MYNNDDFNRFGLFNDEFYKRVRKMFDFDGFMNFDNFDELLNRQIDMNDRMLKRKDIRYIQVWEPEWINRNTRLKEIITREEEVEQIKNNIENLNFNFGFQT